MASDPPQPPDSTPPRQHSRRGFFAALLHEIAAPVGDFLEHQLPELVASGTGADGPESSQRRNISPLAGKNLLRPPGALAESEFLASCLRCNQCVDVCPAHAIMPLRHPAPQLVGTPVIDPDRSACVICDGLHCTHVCPSGALVPLTAPWQIRIGLAEVYEPLCVRSKGEPCTICVDLCPIGQTALTFHCDGPPHVIEEGCTGCGVCQQHCPTTPKAITIKPFHDIGSLQVPASTQ